MGEIEEKKINPYVIIAIIVVVAVIAGAFAVKFYNDSKDLDAQLKEAVDEVNRQKQLTAELEEHNSDLKEENNTLSEQVAAFLNLQEAEPVITSKQLEEQLSAISELVTQKYMYTNAEKKEQGRTLSNGWAVPFSEKSFVVKYDGIIKAGIDLAEVEINVDEEHHIVTVTLPASRITDNNVPQETIEIFGIKDGLFNEVDPNEPNKLISEGKESMEAKAKERGLLTEADEEAENIISAFLSLVPGMGTTYELEFNHK